MPWTSMRMRVSVPSGLVIVVSTGDFSFNARLLREPDAETARRFFEAAALLAPPSSKSDVKKLAERRVF